MISKEKLISGETNIRNVDMLMKAHERFLIQPKPNILQMLYFLYIQY